MWKIMLNEPMFFEFLQKVARGFKTAKNACVRMDLGIQHTFIPL